MKFVPRCSKRTLFIIAGLVWMMAGSMVMKLGYEVVLKKPEYGVVSTITAVIVFAIFYKFIFSKMAHKHKKRIGEKLGEKICMFAFFDVKGYIIMGFMMSMGIFIRSIKAINPMCWAPFYIGLGTALFGAGILFALMWFNWGKEA